LGFEEVPRLERVKRTDTRRWPVLALVLGVALIAVGVLQPWKANSPADADLEMAVATRAAPLASNGDAAALSSRFYPQCFPSLTWRVASLQRVAEREVRSAWPATPEPQPRVRRAATPTLSGTGVEAIGYCTPGVDDVTRSESVMDVSLWRRARSGALVMVENAGVLDPALAAVGEVYLSPPPSLAVAGAWPAGEYFFEIRKHGTSPAANDGGSSWFAIRLVADNHPAVTTWSPLPRAPARFMQSE
jgi:hypothetical protein